MSGSHKTGVARAVSVADHLEAVDTESRVETRDEAPSAASAVEAPAAAPKKKRRSAVLPIIGLALLGAGGWYGFDWWTDGRFLVSTDDAYIQGDIATISPKVTGYVDKVNVVANQRVAAGEPLVTLDQGDYAIVLEQAEAQIATQKLSLDRISAQIDGAKAALQQAEAQKVALEAAVRGATITQKRASELQSKSVGTVASLDNAQVALDQAKANLSAGDASIASAKSNILILEAQRQETASAIRSLELSRDKAKRDLDFTVLKAPYDGIIGNLSVQAGDLVSAGQRLAALVPVNDLYIDANFKETQIHRLKTGEKVRIHVDAFGEAVIEGTVQSISPASGSVFSMLPAENATGNFTKVVQRVPVRIALPREALDAGHLRAGLSVVVDVDTRTAPAERTTAAVQ